MIKNAPKGFKPTYSPGMNQREKVALIIGFGIILLLSACVYLAVRGITDAMVIAYITPYMSVFHAVMILGLLLLGLAAIFSPKYKKPRFWEEVAESYGWTYTKHVSVKEEPALMFRQGAARTSGDMLAGELHGQPFRMFQYMFSVQSGKSATYHSYTVSEFTFSGSFPHLYLNRMGDFYLPHIKQGVMPRVSLPLEFEKKFELYAPAQYEIEALEIFTPDTLAYLLDHDWRYDLEMIDNKLIIFGAKNYGSVREFHIELEKVAGLAQHLANRLNRASLSPIGDRPFRLR